MDEFSYAVIIPNYNKAQYLKKCIMSIYHQTLKPNEIIVVDDCSTDDSLSLLNELSKEIPSLSVVALKQNGGVSNARNVGVQYAKSTYIKFLDADDFYYGNKNCQQEMQLIKQHKLGKGVDVLAYSAIVFSDNAGKTTSKVNVHKKHRFINGYATYDLLARLRFISISNNFMVKKDIFNACGGFNYPHDFYEDYEILIRLSQYVNFYFSGTYGRVYRFTPDGLSKAPRPKHIKALADIFDMYYSKMNMWGKLNVKARILFRDIKTHFIAG